MSVFIPNTNNNTAIVTIPYTGPATQIITVACWIYLPAATPANYRDIVTLDPNIYLQAFSDGITSDFGTAANDHTGPPFAVRQWTHLAIVVVPTSTTSRQIYGYFNGKLQVNITDTSTFTTYTNICIGSSAFSTYAFPLVGNVQDVRVWTRALSPTEIQDEMRTTQTVVHDAALLLWAPLEADKTRDLSGNNNAVTVGSAVTIQGGYLLAWPSRGTAFIR